MRSEDFKNKILTGLQRQLDIATANRPFLQQMQSQVRAVDCDDTDGFKNLLSKAKLAATFLAPVMVESEFEKLTTLQKLLFVTFFTDFDDAYTGLGSEDSKSDDMSVESGAPPIFTLNQECVKKHQISLDQVLFSNQKAATLIPTILTEDEHENLESFLSFSQPMLKAYHSSILDYVNDPYVYTGSNLLSLAQLPESFSTEEGRETIDVEMGECKIFDPLQRNAPVVGTTGLACCIGVCMVAKASNSNTKLVGISHVSRGLQDMLLTLQQKMQQALGMTAVTHMDFEICLVGGAASSLADITAAMSHAKNAGWKIADVSACKDLSNGNDTEIWFSNSSSTLAYFNANDVAPHLDPQLPSARSSKRPSMG
jgi:hypothetical protein